jgi:hypothetical protein
LAEAVEGGLNERCAYAAPPGIRSHDQIAQAAPVLSKCEGDRAEEFFPARGCEREARPRPIPAPQPLVVQVYQWLEAGAILEAVVYQR